MRLSVRKQGKRRRQNYVHNKFQWRWKSHEIISRTAMLSLFGGWASTTTINFLRSGWHFPLHYGICWEFSHPRCPFQRIFPTSAVQTPVSLSGNHWSGSLMGVRVSRKLEPLSLRIWRSQNHRLCIAFSDSDDDDGHKCGQTSRPDVGTEIQTNCNFEAHVYYFNYLLGF